MLRGSGWGLGSWRESSLAMDSAACRRIIQACLERKRGEIVAVFDEKKNPTAAIFCVDDNALSYHLLTTRTVESGSGDVSALIWHGMQKAAARGLIFDLGGLATGGNAFFYSGFGGDVAARYVATRTSLPVQIALVLTRSFSEDYWFI